MSPVINVLEKKKLNDLMVQAGLITQPQLQEALDVQGRNGGKLGQILVRMGYLSEEVLLTFLAKQCGVNYVSLKEYGTISPDVLKTIPENVVRRQSLIPINRNESRLTIAMSDPLNIFIVDDLKLMSGYEIEVVVASESEIKQAIDKYWGNKGSIEEEIRGLELSDTEMIIDEQDNLPVTVNSPEESSAVKIIYFVLANAVKLNVDDIHIEPYAEQLRLRYRIDGVLYEQPVLPKKMQDAIVSRLKVMAQLDAAQHGLVQEGKTKIKVADKEVGLRINVVPTVYGEKIVVYIDDGFLTDVSLDKLGFETDTLNIFKRNINLLCGMVLVTGPGGSGKTVTMYSALNALNQPDRNIVTIENPIKFGLTGINQTQINSGAGMSFVSGLNSLLKQNPDVIMVSELTELEIAKTLFNAALNGRICFSSMCTDDASSTITRLLDMGLEPFLINASLKMVLAQRLVRKICEYCKEPYELTGDFLNNLGFKPEQIKDKYKTVLYRGKGCARCGKTGYSGRAGVFELLEINEGIKELVMKRVPTYMIKRISRKTGMKTLRESVMNKVLAGITTIEEMLRVTNVDVED